MELGKKIVQMFDNTMKRAAAAALEVETMEDTIVVSERLKTCSECVHRNAEREKCGVCGCYIQIKATMKVNHNPIYLQTEFTHCPMGKWGDLEIANHYRAARGQQLIS